MKPIAVLLSGCGVYDGSEIHETVCALLALDKFDAPYQCVAPDILQHQVINHLTGEPMAEKRSVLVEAARLARGKILSLDSVTAENFSGLIVPGGFGAAKNLSDFAFKGKDATVESSVLAFCQSFAQARKPAAYICIAPNLIAEIYGAGVHLTIGNDAQTAATLEAMGNCHENCEVSDFVVDFAHQVVTTPAYMLANRISEVQLGIERCVKQLLDWIGS
jgi:enhancing lycopene biosynthesis protein 2